MMSDKRFLTEENVRTILEELPNGQIFSVIVERVDGSARRIVCKRGVKSRLKGGESTIKGKPNLISVFDTEADGYRCFDVTRVISIKANKVETRVPDALGKDEEVLNGRGQVIKR